jgi:hypothetical protein
MPAAAVTPAGVRDGDPAALAGLCAARGPSVLAYCRQLVGDTDAAEAAADAFARFRATVVAAGALSDLNPEAVLVKATREAAASRAGRGSEGTCAELPQLLAARANKTISDADGERLEEHLESCWACRAPVARFKAAERAYGDPPDRTIEPAVTALIVAALAAAAPSRGAEPAPNGAATRASAAGESEAAGEREAAGTGDGHTTKYRMLGTIGGDSGDTDGPPAKPAGPLVPPGPVASILALLGLKGIGMPKPGGARTARLGRTRGPAREPLAGRVGTGIPRPRAGQPAGPPLQRSSRGRARPPLRLSIVLPIGLVLIALLVALSVSGVFGGSDPASSPSVAVPAERSADSPPADVVIVPGAKDASGDAVELAKARDRARARRQREGSSKRKSKPSAAKKKAPATAPPADAASAPTVAAAPPPAAPPPPPPPPPPAANTTNSNGGATKSGSRKIEAGNGATGSEQIPPAQDTSNVPDLAPPPETATNP